MKILFISSADCADYLCDMAFHGLRCLFGTEVVDVNRLWFMYQGAKLDGMYGKGFTLYGLVDEGNVDRTDISRKIANRYFDLVVFGSVQRCWDRLEEVRRAYPAEQIIFLDGEDSPSYLKDFTKTGLYFKRELHSPQPNVFPIQFGIPEVKIQFPVEKKTVIAPMDPFNPLTYVYEDEKSYYDQYRTAMFAKTTKKAGWDCLRHYEIMACGAIPWFLNLEHCPSTIMQDLPKEDLIVAKALLEYQGLPIFLKPAGEALWVDLQERIHKVLFDKLTTVALAKRMLDTHREAINGTRSRSAWAGPRQQEVVGRAG